MFGHVTCCAGAMSYKSHPPGKRGLGRADRTHQGPILPQKDRGNLISPIRSAKRSVHTPAYTKIATTRMVPFPCPVFCPPNLLGRPKGTFMNNTGAVECFECPERFYCDGSTPRGYADCPVGHYCPAGTGASYIDCPSGEKSHYRSVMFAP